MAKNPTTIFWMCVILHRCFTITQASTSNFSARVCENHIKSGHIMIGGMFEMYLGKNSIPCEGDLDVKSVSWVESMIYAVDTINQRNDILPNVTLGYEIRNDCGYEDIALWTMLTMASPTGNAVYAETCPNHFRGNEQKISGVIGTEKSSTSLLVAKIGGVFAVPVVSYYATSDELGNTERFPFFFRTIPPDKFQVGAIIDLLEYYNWRYIALFYSIDSYGIHGARQIQSLADKRDICIAINVPVSIEPSENDVAEIRETVTDNDKITVIVVFAVRESSKAVLRAIKPLHLSGREFTLIGSDGWSPRQNNQGDFDQLSIGAMFVRFGSEYTSPSKFQDYYRNLPDNQERASHWYRGDVDKASSIELDVPVTQRIIDGVYALAYAFNSSIPTICDVNGTCFQDLNGWNIRNNLNQVSFLTETNKSFQFDQYGEVSGQYKWQNWQFKSGKYEMVYVGLWDPDDAATPLRLSEELIQWGTRDGKVPRSLCLVDCKPGYITVPLKKKCCTGCHRCPDYAIVVVDNDTAASSACYDCPITHWPNELFTTCLLILPDFIDYVSVVFLLSSIGAALGLVFSGFVAIAMCYYSQHALIKSSSRDLSAINIIGLASSCAVVLLILLRPSSATCIVTEVSISTCFCMTYAPMLLKVNRIWRIFNATKGKRPLYTSPRHQLAFAATIIAVQILIACVSLIFTTPIPTILFPAQRKPVLEIYCQFSYGFQATCIYNMLIVIASCYNAFRARRVPKNFNESKFIAISVYSTLIVSLAAIPVYSTALDVAQKIGTLSVTLLVNTYLTLSCLYLPKIYAIHFAGEEARETWRTYTVKEPTDTGKTVATPSAATCGTRKESPSSVVI